MSLLTQDHGMTTEDYRLLDTGGFQKLEKVGPYRIVRPSAQAVWRPRQPEAAWQDCDARFERYSGGNGRWFTHNEKMPESWKIQTCGVTFVIRLTPFGHLGIFPEQHDNWSRLRRLIEGRRSRKGETRVLNLFAYTGGATLACAAGGASVVHVDASKTSVSWARENAQASGLGESPIRWIVDDVQKFVGREVRRGRTYHGIILDPPTFGRGPKGKTWKIEEHLQDLLNDLAKLLADDYEFFLLTAHSPGYTPLSLQNLLGEVLGAQAGAWQTEEMVISEQTEDPSAGGSPRPLPSGASCMATRKPPGDGAKA